MKRFLYIMFVALLLMSCKTQVMEVPIETVKTEYVYAGRVDSVFVKDSVDRYVSGDTLILYRNLVTYRYINKTDTLIKEKKVEVPKIVEVKETVEVNHIKWYQKLLMWVGGVAVLISILYLFYILKIRRWTLQK